MKPMMIGKFTLTESEGPSFKVPVMSVRLSIFISKKVWDIVSRDKRDLPLKAKKTEALQLKIGVTNFDVHSVSCLFCSYAVATEHRAKQKSMPCYCPLFLYYGKDCFALGFNHDMTNVPRFNKAIQLLPNDVR